MAAAALLRPFSVAVPRWSWAWAGLLAVLVHALAFWAIWTLIPTDAMSTIGVYVDDGRRMVAGQVPYRDFTFEYPPLAAPLMWLPALLSGSSVDGFRAFFLVEMLVADLLGAVLSVWAAFRYRVPGAVWAVVLAQPIWLLAAGRPIVLERFDLAPAVVALLAIILFVERHDRWAWVTLGIATALKLYPAVIGPLFLLAAWCRRSRRDLVLDLLAGTAAVVLPCLAAVHGDVPALATFLSYHLERGLEIESTYSTVLLVLHQLAGLPAQKVDGHGAEELAAPMAGALASLSLPLTVAGLGAIYWLGRRLNQVDLAGGEGFAWLVRLSVGATFAFILLGKVLSPQYLLWVYPLLPFVGVGWLSCAVLYGGSLLLSRWIYPDHWSDLLNLQVREVLLLVIRNLVLVAVWLFLVLPVRRAWRADLVAGLAALLVLAGGMVALGWAQTFAADLGTQADRIAGPVLSPADHPPSVSLADSDAAPRQGQVLGRLDASNGLMTPRGVRVAADGSVYVADAGAHMVLHFAADGTVLQRIGQPGDGPGSLDEPFDLALGADGTLFVLDGARGTIEEFAADGSYRQRFAPGVSFYHPRSLSLDARGHLVVADTGGSRVVDLGPDGQVAHEWGKASGDEFNQPTSAILDEQGNLYVAEPAAQRLDKLAPDGHLLARRDISGSDTLQAAHLALTGDGQILLTDPPRGRVGVLDADLRWVATLAAPEQAGHPLAVGVAPDGSAWVSDAQRPEVDHIGRG